MRSNFSCSAHILIGEPVSTSPEYAQPACGWPAGPIASHGLQ
jgi:hypothetical protein